MDWLREPLVHFLVAGAALFAVHAVLEPAADPPRVVRLTESEVVWLTETWTRQWQRPPGDAELQGLVSDYLMEQLLAREALELGLGENDTVVRRRLAQKMEFLLQETTRLTPPGEDDLRRSYEENRASYASPETVSFTQIFFATESAARAAVDEIASSDPRDLGDATLLDREIEGESVGSVALRFGASFRDAVRSMEPGGWHGPVRSDLGWHLVRVNARQPAGTQPFEAVRDEVLAHWWRQRGAQARSETRARLLQKYDVVADASVQSLVAPLATR